MQLVLVPGIGFRSCFGNREGEAISNDVSAAIRVMGKNNSTRQNGQNRRVVKVACSYSTSVMDPYRTLRIDHGASESEVKKAFRLLALQYHPDVCRGSNCGVQFHMINEAYHVVMSQLRGEEQQSTQVLYEDEGMNDPDLELWEEWMGWEGGGIRDYSSHINPYI